MASKKLNFSLGSIASVLIFGGIIAALVYFITDLNNVLERPVYNSEITEDTSLEDTITAVFGDSNSTELTDYSSTTYDDYDFNARQAEIETEYNRRLAEIAEASAERKAEYEARRAELLSQYQAQRAELDAKYEAERIAREQAAAREQLAAKNAEAAAAARSAACAQYAGKSSTELADADQEVISAKNAMNQAISHYNTVFKQNHPRYSAVVLTEEQRAPRLAKIAEAEAAMNNARSVYNSVLANRRAHYSSLLAGCN